MRKSLEIKNVSEERSRNKQRRKERSLLGRVLADLTDVSSGRRHIVLECVRVCDWRETRISVENSTKAPPCLTRRRKTLR